MDVKHQFGPPSWEAWRGWLEAHVNRELGVGAPPRGWRDPPSRAVMDAVLDELGRPQRRYRRVIVAGTNGKTTVTRATSALVQAMDLQVGTYTSPHLHLLNERIAVDGAPVPDEVLARAFSRIAAAEAALSLELSWFEIMTAAAMLWFAWEEVDLAVIEVGLGGEHDATAAAMPALVAFTNVDLDHTELFGATRREIAAAEATIVSPGYGLILGEIDASLHDCFRRRHPDPLWVRGTDFDVPGRASLPEGQLITLRTPTAIYRDVPIALRGSMHAENLSLALMAAECAVGPVPEPIVRRVLPALRAPGRVELVSSEPTVLLDGAHNPAGARALAAVLVESFPPGRRTYIVGLSADKPAAEIVTGLGIRSGDRVVCCSADTPRARAASDLAEIVRVASPDSAIEAVPSVEDALRRAVGSPPAADLVVVTGSLYVVAEARRILGRPVEVEQLSCW